MNNTDCHNYSLSDDISQSGAKLRPIPSHLHSGLTQPSMVDYILHPSLTSFVIISPPDLQYKNSELELRYLTSLLYMHAVQ